MVGAAVGGVFAVPNALSFLIERLNAVAWGGTQVVADTASVAKVEGQVSYGGRGVPFAVTAFKESERARVQLLTHDLSTEDAEKVLMQVAEALDLRIVARSQPESEQKVHEAFAQHAPERAGAPQPPQGERPQPPQPAGGSF